MAGPAGGAPPGHFPLTRLGYHGRMETAAVHCTGLVKRYDDLVAVDLLREYDYNDVLVAVYDVTGQNGYRVGDFPGAGGANDGKVVEIAPVNALFRTPKHPYTEALMSSVPIQNPRMRNRRNRIRLEGDVVEIFPPAVEAALS